MATTAKAPIIRANSLEALLRYLVKEPKVKKITILAHSMGNWVTLEALRQMAIRDKRIDPKIALVLLADPDVDVDVSREQIAQMGPNRPHIALFVSEDDRALAASKELWGAPRLGAVNPDIEPYKTMLERENITVINLTHLPSHDSFNHGKFAEDPKVVELIGRSLANGQTLSQSQVGFGEKIMQTTASAASTVGHAAGLAISAPVAIVDPDTREHLGDQVDELTSSAARIGPQKEPWPRKRSGSAGPSSIRRAAAAGAGAEETNRVPEGFGGLCPKSQRALRRQRDNQAATASLTAMPVASTRRRLTPVCSAGTTRSSS